MTESNFILISLLLMLFVILFSIIFCKWNSERVNKIEIEQEYHTLLERSIIICDELSKAEELVITQNKIIAELRHNPEDNEFHP